VAATARQLHLSELLDRRPAQLSGGQKQRVAMGRAIIREPELFLLDEPLSNLDSGLRAHARGEIREVQNRLRTTMLYVTHDQIEAQTLADRIVVMRQGAVQQVGSPREVFARPANLFVASILGAPQINIVPATISTPDGRSPARRCSSKTPRVASPGYRPARRRRSSAFGRRRLSTPATARGTTRA
jgi:ABC-type sugar transport system ATPase subunit